MSPALFILSITCYLVSMASALVISFFSKLIPSRFTNTVIIFHFLSFITWIILPKEEYSISNPSTSNYFFLIFFCSGIITAGMVLRKAYTIFLKIYFALFLISLPVFIVSPSRVLGFVASGSINSINPQRFHISENYFLVEQHNGKGGSDSIPFKIVREMGMFHKTLAREVILPAQTDSVKLLSMSENISILVRVYSSPNNSSDSLDLNIPFTANRDSTRIITRKPQ